jgi:hypothetical protein
MRSLNAVENPTGGELAGGVKSTGKDGPYAGESTGGSEKLKRIPKYPSSSGVNCSHFLLKCALPATNGTI